MTIGIKLSKPVADLYEMQFEDGHTCAFHTDVEKAIQWLNTCDGNKVQEYVKLDRIAELGFIRQSTSQVFNEIDNELGCNPDNESIMMTMDELKEREKRVVALANGNSELWETMAARLEAAEAKLATPVRLPDRYSIDCGVCTDPSGEWLSYHDVIAALREQGLKVEGDEQ